MKISVRLSPRCNPSRRSRISYLHGFLTMAGSVMDRPGSGGPLRMMPQLTEYSWRTDWGTLSSTITSLNPPAPTWTGGFFCPEEQGEPPNLETMKNAIVVSLLLLFGPRFPVHVQAATLYAASSTGIFTFDADTGTGNGQLHPHHPPANRGPGAGGPKSNFLL